MALEFEKPILDLETRIKELRLYGESNRVDMTEEVLGLERRLERLRSETFDGLTRWQRVQLARAPGRQRREVRTRCRPERSEGAIPNGEMALLRLRPLRPG